MSDHDDVTPPTPPDQPAETPSSAETSPGGGVSPNRGPMIVLSYLWILALIPLLVEKDDAEVQWHAKHGLVLTAAELVLWVVIMAINSFSAFLGCLLAPLYFAIWLAILILHIACIAKGTKGERLIVPGVSQYADRF